MFDDIVKQATLDAAADERSAVHLQLLQNQHLLQLLDRALCGEQLAATEILPMSLMEIATIQDQTVVELTLSKRDIQLAPDKKGDGPDLFVVPVKGRRDEQSCYMLFYSYSSTM